MFYIILYQFNNWFIFFEHVFCLYKFSVFNYCVSPSFNKAWLIDVVITYHIFRGFRPLIPREERNIQLFAKKNVDDLLTRWRSLHILKITGKKPNNSVAGHWSFLKYAGFFAVGGLVVKSKISHANCSLKLSHKSASHHNDNKQENENKQPKFKFREFWKFLWPDIWLLLLASLSAFAVAMVNIELPMMLGNLVNAVSSLSSGRHANDFFQVLKEPALKLISIYGAQAILTFAYISFLSCLGERLAERMRNALFASLVRQDIAFFDSHKTGELVYR